MPQTPKPDESTSSNPSTPSTESVNAESTLAEQQRLARNEKKRLARQKEKVKASLRRGELKKLLPEAKIPKPPARKKGALGKRGVLNRPPASPAKGVRAGDLTIEEFLAETSGLEFMRLAEELLSPPISFGEFIQRTTNLPTGDVMGPIVLEPWQWHLCNRLEKLVDQKGQRIMVHKPPQHGGSILASMRLCAYLLGRNPLHRFRQVTHNQEHSEQFSQVTQDTMRTREYQEIFPYTQIPKQTNLREWSTMQREKVRDGQPSFVSMGIQGAGVGIGGDTFLIDDPYGNPKDAYSVVINNDIRLWHNSLLIPRLTPQSNVVVLFHRFQPEDYAGWLEAQGGWEIIRYAALGDCDNDPMNRAYDEPLAPKRYDFAYLDELRRRDPMTFYGLYQGKPTVPEGNAIKRGWFDIIGDYDAGLHAQNNIDLELGLTAKRYRYFDPKDIFSARIYFDVGASAAPTADRTVGTFGVKMKDGTEIWLWQMAGQWDPNDRDLECVKFCLQCRAIIPYLVVNIEEGFGLGADTVKRMASKIEACNIKVKTDRAKGTKWARANDRTDSFMSVAQAGGIKFYAGNFLNKMGFTEARKNWIEPYLAEVCRLIVKQTDNGITLEGGKDDRFDSGVSLHNKLSTEKKRMTGESMRILTERMFDR